MNNNSTSDENYEEKREFKHVPKNFVLSYFDLENPKQTHEISQLKNISMGGICFITSQEFRPSTQVGIELKTPFVQDVTYLEGIVLQSHQKVQNMVYETRLQFKGLNPQAEFLLAKMMDYFLSTESLNDE